MIYYISNNCQIIQNDFNNQFKNKSIFKEILNVLIKNIDLYFNF